MASQLNHFEEARQARASQQEQETRMECLRLTMQGREGWAMDKIIAEASRLYAFVTNQQEKSDEQPVR